jgi:hypothetical protein
MREKEAVRNLLKIIRLSPHKKDKALSDFSGGDEFWVRVEDILKNFTEERRKMCGDSQQECSSLRQEIQQQQSVTTNSENSSNSQEPQKEISPEEARKVIENFKPSRDGKNKDKVIALQVALNSL